LYDILYRISLDVEPESKTGALIKSKTERMKKVKFVLDKSMLYIMVRNLHLPNGKRQTPYKKNQNVTMVLEFCMQRNCCCNEKIAELRKLLKYPWLFPFFSINKIQKIFLH
jgi:hypothetical protein